MSITVPRLLAVAAIGVSIGQMHLHILDYGMGFLLLGACIVLFIGPMRLLKFLAGLAMMFISLG